MSRLPRSPKNGNAPDLPHRGRQPGAGSRAPPLTSITISKRRKERFRCREGLAEDRKSVADELHDRLLFWSSVLATNGLLTVKRVSSGCQYRLQNLTEP